MSIKELFNLESENTDKVFLYREGIFWRAYERSAYILSLLGFNYKINYIDSRECPEGVLYMGFPYKVIKDKIAYFSIIKCTDNNMVLGSSLTLSDQSFFSWKAERKKEWFDKRFTSVEKSSPGSFSLPENLPVDCQSPSSMKTVKKHRMLSYVDENGRVVKPAFVKLGIYKKGLDVYKSLQIGKRPRSNVSREIKYTDISEVKCSVRKIIRLAVKADNVRDREERASIIYDALVIVPELYIILRTLFDLSYITDKRWTDVTLKLESLRRQLYGWYEYTCNEIPLFMDKRSLPDDTHDLLFDI